MRLQVIKNRVGTFMQNENGERDENRVNVTEPDEHGVHGPNGVLLNLRNLFRVDQAITFCYRISFESLKCEDKSYFLLAKKLKSVMTLTISV